MKNVLTIAGSDSCSGAGIQADIKTFSALQVYGVCVITAITAQNTQKVISIEGVSSLMVRAQLNALNSDIQIDAIKIGMLYDKAIIEEVIHFIKMNKNIKNTVVDPLIMSSSGRRLLKEDAIESLVNKLFPIVDLITPNLQEASFFAKREINELEDVYQACKVLKETGCKHVLIKGGHFENEAIDVLYDGKDFNTFTYKKLDQKNTHGTGCTLSAAIAANLAKGLPMTEAVEKGKMYITEAIRGGFSIGQGPGALLHFFNKKPLIHFLTNQVTINDVANVAIAMGASPIMAQEENELEEVIRKASFCVINTGTVDENRFRTIEAAMGFANKYRVPILLDPVGCGASTYRNEWVKKLLATYGVKILKVNGSEGKALLKKASQAIGVDSEILASEEAKEIALLLSKQYKCIVVITGETDYIANATKINKVEGGSALLQSITGAGCMLNSIIATLGSNQGELYETTVSALGIMKQAAKLANEDLKPFEGPMAFKTKLIDAIYYLNKIKTTN